MATRGRKIWTRLVDRSKPVDVVVACRVYSADEWRVDKKNRWVAENHQSTSWCNVVGLKWCAGFRENHGAWGIQYVPEKQKT